VRLKNVDVSYMLFWEAGPRHFENSQGLIDINCSNGNSIKFAKIEAKLSLR